MRRIHCCEQCFDDLFILNPDYAHLWVRFCSSAGGILKYHESALVDLHDLMRPLEILGYITTHEHDKAILIRSNGYMDDGVEESFCLERFLHKKKNVPPEDDTFALKT